MKKESKEQTNKKKRIIILITVIALIGIIVGSIVIRNFVVKQETEGENYLAGGDANSSLMASYIRKGVTIGGITGTLESLDTSDATATPEDILEGKTAYVNGVKITGIMRTGPGLGDITGNETQNTETQDSLGNKVVVPAGFKVVNPQDNVEKGIIIEDVSAGDSNTKGSQFVWIPVGKIKTSAGEIEITFGRYEFDYVSGILAQAAEKWSDTSDSVIVENYYKELPSSNYGNKVAKDLEKFITKTQKSGGYYIGRYEAGDAKATSTERTSSSSDNNPIVCKMGVYPYNCITQLQAATLCQNMYDSNNFTSDLINSYAWDTAIVFIHKCSGDKNYSRQSGINTQGSLQKLGESILAKVDSGDEIKDVRCNIYDMAGNTKEWTTETYTNAQVPCVPRGGEYKNTIGNEVCHRSGSSASSIYSSEGCRPILYL